MNSISQQHSVTQRNQPLNTPIKDTPSNTNKSKVEQSCNVAERVIYLTLSALKGCPAAQYELGILYSVGQGVEKNKALSISWLKEAAQHSEHPHMEAQYMLGMLYAVGGYGVEQNPTKAFFWLFKAAEQGHVKAKSKLGDMYYNGHGVDKDIGKAFECYQYAANKDDAWAQYMVGEIHYTGALGQPDYLRAASNFKKAANQGIKEANYKLGKIYSCSEKGVQLDNWIALRHFSAAGKKGYAAGHYMVGMMYMGVAGIPTDLNEAFKWFKKAADKGHAKAQFFLASFYLEALGPVFMKDVAKGIDLIKKSADQGYVDALLILGRIYRGRFDLKPEPEKAFTCFQQATMKESAEAEFEMAVCYETGFGIAADETAAFKWYKKSALHDYAPAKTMLGAYYTWIKKDLVKAVFWYTKAAKQDDENAQHALGILNFKGGPGLPINLAEAEHWLTEASNRGVVAATKKLAEMHRSGQCVNSSMKKALGLENLATIQDMHGSDNNKQKI